jgi:hypothetical protein
MVQGIGTVLGALALLVAAWFGKTTFEAWRKQQIAGRKLVQAERILEATYKARRALSYVRGPIMLGHELTAAEEMLKDKDFWTDSTEAKRRRMVTAQGIFNRMSRYADEQEALDQCLPMARALFGEDLEKGVDTLRRQFWMVHVDVESYLDDDGTDKDFTRKIREGMYEISARKGEVNEVTDAIETSVATIEKHCLPVLRS